VAEILLIVSDVARIINPAAFAASETIISLEGASLIADAMEEQNSSLKEVK
jgi:hypothetical protein